MPAVCYSVGLWLGSARRWDFLLIDSLDCSGLLRTTTLLLQAAVAGLVGAVQRLAALKEGTLFDTLFGLE